MKVALGNRGMTVEAARQCAKDRKEWRALVHIMAVARGVQGGRHLPPPPQLPGHWKKIDKDYSNWMGINKFFITICR